MPKLAELLKDLSNAYGGLSPQLKRAAKFVIDNPAEVAIDSMRQVAGQAKVTPSTMLRLARAFECKSYDEFRAAFRQAVRDKGEGYSDRARWLQSVAEQEGGGPLFGQLATANLSNLEQVLASIYPADLAATAETLATADRAIVLGLRSAFSLAHYFYYVGRMALPNLIMAPGQPGLQLDELAGIGPNDALLTIGFSPYAQETVRGTRFAAEKGAAIAALTDSRVSPLATDARHILIAPTTSPQFFPSMAAATVLVEALIAFIVARGGGATIDRITDHSRLHRSTGALWEPRPRKQLR